MNKQLFQFLAIITVVFLVSYFVHNLVLESLNITLSFSIFKVYLFHFVASAFVFGATYFVFLALPNQAGYVYLASIFLKIGFFLLLFKSSVFSEVELTKPERFSLVIPLFLFLMCEAISISKLLNSK